jgi:uncharacterized protein with von Willebrand factor type A (vWA) domain
MAARYSRWGGTQPPDGPDMSPDDLLELLSDALLAGEGAESALNRLLARGIPGYAPGLDSVRRRFHAAAEMEAPGDASDVRDAEKTIEISAAGRPEARSGTHEGGMDVDHERDPQRSSGPAFDEEAESRMRGDPAASEVRRLAAIEPTLERAGYFKRTDNGLSVTPLGARRIGALALRRAFDHIRRDLDRPSASSTSTGPGEPSGRSRKTQFGDSGPLAVQQTVFNAVVRQGPKAKLRLDSTDFESVEVETRTEAATVLLLDLSYSMPQRGHLVPAKRSALAMRALIDTRYPKDSLYMVGFSDYARQLQPEDLTAISPAPNQGTNMHHAFNLAARLLARHSRAFRQVILFTDGEPTAHLENASATYAWPPSARTYALTLRAAAKLAQSRVTLNIFMLEATPALVEFIERLAKITHGRVFQMAGHDNDLPSYVTHDYTRLRRR